MGTQAAISVEEYLRTSFADLDKEYVDGLVVERSLPDEFHSMAQANLIGYFAGLKKRLSIFPRPELRLKVRTGRYRIPDVSVFYPMRPEQAVPDAPPFIAIEILSSDDRMVSVEEKLKEYRTWGVPHVWLADPHSRRLYTYEGGLREVAALTIAELEIVAGSADLFD